MSGSGLTVYLVAFACEPDRGSEPGVGWVFTTALADASREHGWSAVVVTRPHRLAKIRDALHARGDDHVQVLTVGVPWLLHARGARDVRVASAIWQWRAVRAIGRRIGPGSGLAVVHHVTFATEAVPTFEHRLGRSAALVFGPAGSTAQGGDRSIRRRLRRALGAATLRTSDLLVATNAQVAATWGARTQSPIVIEPNIVVEPLERGEEAWDVVVVGELIPRKRVDLALHSVALVDRPIRMAIVGDGPLRAELESLSARLGLADRVEFLGAVGRDGALDVMTRSRVLLHTSRQEGSAWVVGEAQAAGAFVVAVAGTGADDAARRGGSAIALTADPSAIADALEVALDADLPGPSNRWSQARLPGLLPTWYEDALEHAAARRKA